jgi:hypothetical protein
MSNKRSLTALFLVAGVVVVLAGGLMASNMGFKLNRTLSQAGAGSNSGTNALALPYNRQVGIDTAKALFQDIGNTDAQLIQQFVPASDTYNIYTFGSPDFALVSGEGYFVKMTNNVNYIVVGSHDPSASIQLNAAGPQSASGTNFFAPPYHATASTAKELFIEIGILNTQLIQKFLPATDTYQLYTFGSTDFALSPGESYFVKMNNSIPYMPSHY